MTEEKKSGLAKAATILVTMFLVSLGLCGLNFLALVGGGVMGNGSSVLITTAYLELAGMVVGAAGLLIVGVIAIVQGVIDQFSTRSPDSVSIIEKDEEK